jgi:DNA-directed RNA polymerase subunit M
MSTGPDETTSVSQDGQLANQAFGTEDLFCECGSMRRISCDGAFRCTSCGTPAPHTLELDIVVTQEQRNRSLTIADEIEETFAHPTKECPSCGSNAVHNVIKQTRAADEPGTLFFKCTDCRNKWREEAL